VKTTADARGVARSNLTTQASAAASRRRRGRSPRSETELLAEIKVVSADQPTYGYRRVHALIRRRRREEGGAAVNVKRVYRMMKARGLLLARHTGDRRGLSEVSVEQNRDPTNRNRIRGSVGRTSGQDVAKSISIKDRDCKSGGCARKVVEHRESCAVSFRTEGVARHPDRGAEVSRGHTRPARRPKARTVPDKGSKERASRSDVS